MKTYQESITAKICSFVRAYHSAYAKHKIYDDSLAYDLLGQNEYLRLVSLLSTILMKLRLKMTVTITLIKRR